MREFFDKEGERLKQALLRVVKDPETPAATIVNAARMLMEQAIGLPTKPTLDTGRGDLIVQPKYRGIARAPARVQKS